MTTQRPRWATYNTWARTRRRSKSARRKARRELAELFTTATTVAATQNRSNTMSDYWSEEAMEARQDARRAAIMRCGTPAVRSKPQAQPKPPTEREQLLAAGFTYSVAQRDRQAADAEHRGLRRRADAEVTQRDSLHGKLRDLYGPDYADGWMNADGAA
nr:hypothetical protein OG781_17790 [Streptomyces sp. NBC_00830]